MEASARLSAVGDRGRQWGCGAAGYAIGVIAVETDFPLLPGNVANATTFPFPVYIKVLKGISGADIMRYNPEYSELIIDAANELLELGVSAVVGACGSFANYQMEVAAALPVPTYLSVMLQVPMITQGLQPEQTIGVIAARAEALTSRVFEQCSISAPERLSIYSAMNLDESVKLFAADASFDSSKLESELVALACEIIEEHPQTGAIVIQCSDLPPYTAAIQQAVGLPVYDGPGLIHWVYNSVVPRTWPSGLDRN